VGVANRRRTDKGDLHETLGACLPNAPDAVPTQPKELLQLQWITPRQQSHFNAYNWKLTAKSYLIVVVYPHCISSCITWDDLLTLLQWTSLIHSLKNFYNASSSPLLLRGAPDSSTVKKNSFKTTIEWTERQAGLQSGTTLATDSLYLTCLTIPCHNHTRSHFSCHSRKLTYYPVPNSWNCKAA